MSVLSFRYEGATTERHGMQHGCAGDEVYDDDRGVGILDKIDGSHVFVEFGASGAQKVACGMQAYCSYAVVVR